MRRRALISIAGLAAVMASHPSAAQDATTASADDLASKTAQATYDKLIEDLNQDRLQTRSDELAYTKSLFPGADQRSSATVSNNGGTAAAAILTARSLDIAALRITKDWGGAFQPGPTSAQCKVFGEITRGCNNPGAPAELFIFTGQPTLTLAHYAAFQQRYKALDEEWQTAGGVYDAAEKATKDIKINTTGMTSSGQSRTYAFFISPPGLALAALSAVATDYTLEDVALDNEDSRAALAFYKAFTTDTALKAAVPRVDLANYMVGTEMPTPINDDLAAVDTNVDTATNDLILAKSALSALPKGDKHDMMQAAVTALQSYLTDATAFRSALGGGGDTAIPLSLVVQEARVADAVRPGGYALFVRVTRPLASVISKKNVFSIFGGIPIDVQGGAELEYYLIDLSDWTTIKADSKTIATNLVHLRDVKPDIRITAGDLTAGN